MEMTQQASDIVVIHDRCEVCGQIVAVLRSGHLEDHPTKDGQYNGCLGSGFLAITVIDIYRNDRTL